MTTWFPRASVRRVGLSFGEFLIVLCVVVFIFGVPKLPQIGDGLGRAIRNFRRALKGDNEIDVTPPKQVPPPKDQ